MGSFSYPSHNGVPVRPEELDLLPSQLEPDSPSSYSIHHLLFPAKWYTDILFGTLRDLESMQVKLPLDQHNFGQTALHTKYGPPRKPSVREAVDYIKIAFSRGEHLRYGSIGKPVLKPLTEVTLDQVLLEAAYLEAGQEQTKNTWRAYEKRAQASRVVILTARDTDDRYTGLLERRYAWKMN